jgi:hypothetical protein
VGGIRTVAAATFAALVMGLVGVPAGPASAAPVPTTALPVALDRAAFYEKQTVCDPTPRPGTSALGDLILRTYGPATVYIPRACTSSTSEHFDGRALDWMRSVRVPDQKAAVDDFLAWLLAPAADGTPHEMARRLGVMYIIWNNRMIRMYDPGRGWTNYRNCLDPSRAGTGLDTSCHRDHVHLSLSWDGAAGINSWWTGVAQTQPFCSSRSTKASPGSGTPAVVADPASVPGLVPLPATTILDTRAGSGAGLGGSCRLLAGRSLFPVAAVPGVVPDSAAAVAVSVTSASNAPATLTAWSSGAARPAGQVRTPIGTTSSTLLVPLASDGTIALRTSLGAANVSARVVGYVTSMPGAPTASPTASPASSTAAQEPAATKAKRPSKPRKVRVKVYRGKGKVKVRWKKPKRRGSSAITGYRVQALKGKKKGARVVGTCTASAKKRSCKIKNLKRSKRGKKYYMSVSVTNDAGTTWAKRKRVRVR